MAEVKKAGEKKHSHHSGGEMHFGVEVLLFVVVIFILWILAGGAKKTPAQNPLIPQPAINTGTPVR
jgi:hypothetical protein